MKYYLIFNMMYNDGTKDSNSEYTYDTEAEAITNFHKQLGGWRAKENVKHILAMVINSEGGVYATETYTNDAPAPVEETTDTE